MTKLFPSGHATHPQWRMAAALVLAQLRAQMALPGYAREPSLGLLYITDHYANDAAPLLEFMTQQLPDVKAWCGTVGIGVAASNVEYFDEPALSVLLCDVPPAQWRLFSGIAPLPRVGHGFFSAQTALVHANEFTPDLGDVLEEMAQRTNTGHVFGGVTASRGPQVQFSLDLLRQHARPGDDDSGVFQGGLSGVAFGPEVQWMSRVTQGCRPIAPWGMVTAAHDNLVLELDGVPALDALLETLGVTLEGDTQPAIRAVGETMVGLLEAGSHEPHSTGHFGAETRVRHILGLDTTRRGVALAEPVEVGTLLAFCQRHAGSARADLMRICAEIREELEPEENVLPVSGSTDPENIAAYEQTTLSRRILGAIYVSGSERSGEFFGGSNAELQIVRRALGDVPLTGFFARGEIAAHRLYGYAGVLTVFVGSTQSGAEP
ncbi:FIST signal transduction protein [Diaphorobacter aerolatus]|uniref:FIST C-terminal domain-containing protein n=1 Tax=Diaphorobacter aerolatus TaxID=1288495 RepID=A0A7H0GH75_9BURK|nr:FIST N-terminal domain-containing protein [Diaphorobacter aerolatus]QNP47641.1 FIST C-terminal domain-containing protein [Diaphorobacter aerolatus]